jgi:hypothetical protein
VEDQRLARTMLEVQHLPDEQRVVPGPVGVHQSRDDVGERSVDQRHALDLAELDLRALLRSAREVPADLLLVAGEDADSVTTSAGSSDTDMKPLAVMPCTCSPDRVLTIVTPVAKVPSASRKRR